MASEDLHINITGDASGLEQASAKATSALGQISISAKEWQARAQQLGVETSNISAITKSFGTTVQETGVRMTGVSGGAIRAQYALSGLERAFRGNGIQGYIFGLQQTAREIGDLTAQTGSFGGAMSAVGKTLMGPAGIIFGIGFLAEIIAKFVRSSKDGTNSAKEFQKSLDSVTKGIKSVGDALGTGIADSAKEAETLDVLYNAATNTANAYDLRYKAAQKLIQLHPASFSANSEELIMTGKLSDAYDNLRQHILDVAMAKGLMNSITTDMQKQADIVGKIYDLQQKRKDLITQQTEAQNNYNKALNAQPSVGVGSAAGGLSTTLGGNFQKIRSQLADTNDALKENQNEIDQWVKTYSDAGGKIQAISKLLNVNDFIDGIKDPKGKKAPKEKIGEITKIIQQLNDNLLKIDENAKTTGTTFSDIYFDKQKEIQRAIDAIITKFHTLTDVGKNLQGVMRDNARLFAPVNEFLNADSSQAGIEKGTSSVIGINSKGAVGGGKGFGMSNNWADNYLHLVNNPQLEAAQKEFMERLQKQITLAHQLGNEFGRTFETILNGGNVFKSIQQFIEQLLVKMASLVGEAAILSLLTGGGNAVIGFGFSGILKGLVGSYAGGGYIPGPQLAIVGDAPGGEWVLNRNQMSNLINSTAVARSQNVNIFGEFKISGHDLVATVNNTNRRFGKIN